MVKQLGNKISNNKKTWIPIVIAVAILLAICSRQIISWVGLLSAQVSSGAIFPLNLTHEQETWLAALEWCESSGVPAKINKKDLDGTSSYFSFQFKPSTFKLYGIRYGLFYSDVNDDYVKQKMADYELQKKMVSLMFSDPRVNWKREFPDCVKRIGLPPIKK